MLVSCKVLSVSTLEPGSYFFVSLPSSTFSAYRMEEKNWNNNEQEKPEDEEEKEDGKVPHRP